MKVVTERDIRAHFLDTEKHAGILEGWWEEVLPKLEKPSPSQFIRWAKIHSGDLTPLHYAFGRAKERMRYMKFSDDMHSILWISATANNYRRQPVERAA